MRLVAPPVAIVVLIACSSSWEIREGDLIPIQECQKKLFYVDGDGDGWGDRPADDPWRILCSADESTGYTASNGRDCDDDDSTITGAVGSVCPHNLAEGENDLSVGAVVSGSEFIAVIGAESQMDYTAATVTCVGWGGLEDTSEDSESQVWVERGHLATFSSNTEIDEIETLIESNLNAGEDAEFYVGIAWDGEAADSGSWAWVDGSTSVVISSSFSWCDGTEPTPSDFYPHLQADDDTPYSEDGQGSESSSPMAAILDDLPNMRLAYRYTSGQWCLGVAEATTAQSANYICERSTPDPLHFVEVATQEQIDASDAESE